MATDTRRHPSTETAILARLIRPDDATLTPAAAEGLLAIRFQQQDLDRMHELAVKNQDGVLTPAEKAERL
jgi:hypothetical protein